VKRVLNSGSISLPYIQGSEKDLEKDGYKVNELSDAWMENYVAEKLLDKIKFTFEIKAPLFVFNVFQDANLGALQRVEGTNSEIIYVPSQFYRHDGLTYNIMDAKACNDYNTKLNNFYHWSLQFYNKLLESGLCESQAKMVLPQGMFTTFSWEVNAKDLISFIEQNHDQSPELNGYCSTLVLYMEDHLPQVTRWLKTNKWKDLI
jgi:thymidylate synthase ThyX